MLAPWAGGADEICPDADVVRMLRYLPGRRVATLIESQRGLAVLKVFASPRARGNHRRLQVLAATAAADVVPVPIASDSSGHVGLVEFVDGTPLDRLPPRALTRASRLAGQALATLHASAAQLDRTWSPVDEAAQLRAMAGPLTAALVEAILAGWEPRPEPLVASHRDCHPSQAVLSGDRVRWIDLDDAANAPAGLDVGNFLAHLADSPTMLAVPPMEREMAAAAFQDAYGAPPPGLESWRLLSLVRLAALAETRFGRPERAFVLGAAADAGVARQSRARQVSTRPSRGNLGVPLHFIR